MGPVLLLTPPYVCFEINNLRFFIVFQHKIKEENFMLKKIG
jgi:hypothetical protein